MLESLFYMKKEVCRAPWNLLRIENDGNCYSCSSAYVKDYYTFGNIFEDDINEIWNGEKALKFRKDKYENVYDFCKRDICNLFASEMCSYYRNVQLNNNDESLEKYITPYPVYVSLSYDFSCSERCVFCRDKVLVLDENESKKWESILYSKLIPFLQNVKIVEMTCAGELLTSKHSQRLLKKILKALPNIKLKLFSNGIFCTEQKFLELGILENIEEVCISLHCVNKNTYKKIFRTDNFDKVMDNISYISSLKKEGKIKEFCLQFVIIKENYREIKKFIKFALSCGANPVFNFVVENQDSEFCKNHYNYSINKQNHYLYNDFVQTLQDNFVKKYIPEHMKSMKKVSCFKILRNYFDYFLYNLKARKI